MALLIVRARPGARREGFCGWRADLPDFAVRAAPADGAANVALERGLAAALGAPRRAVRLVGGATSRTKRFQVDGLEPETLDRLVAECDPR